MYPEVKKMTDVANVLPGAQKGAKFRYSKQIAIVSYIIVL